MTQQILKSIEFAARLTNFVSGLAFHYVADFGLWYLFYYIGYLKGGSLI